MFRGPGVHARTVPIGSRRPNRTRWIVGMPRPRGDVVKVTAVRTRYEHIAAGWRRATRDRRAGLLGELELLALQLPAVVPPEDPDRAEIIALRAAIRQLITEITIGLADPT